MNLELRNYPLDTIKELNLYCLESTKTQTRLSFIELMPNLEKLILINPQFQLQSQWIFWIYNLTMILIEEPISFVISI